MLIKDSAQRRRALAPTEFGMNPELAERLTGRDLEGDVVHRGEVAELLDHVPDVDGGHGGHSWVMVGWSERPARARQRATRWSELVMHEQPMPPESQAR